MQLSGIWSPAVYWTKVVLYMLPFLHAIFNPIIYFAMSRNFRKMAVRNIKKCYKCQPVAGGTGQQAGPGAGPPAHTVAHMPRRPLPTPALTHNFPASTQEATAAGAVHQLLDCQAVAAVAETADTFGAWPTFELRASHLPQWQSRPSNMTATIRKKSVINCLLPTARVRSPRPVSIRVDNSSNKPSNEMIEEEDILALRLMNRAVSRQQLQVQRSLQSERNEDSTTDK